MFQRILLAWQADLPPHRALDVAGSLAEAYEAELAVCCIGNGTAEAQAAVGADASVTSVSKEHADRELLRYAYAHGFDLLVLGRSDENEALPRRLIERASMPVLVVAEEERP